MNYSADPLELKAERLLRSCAILPLLKGFYPLRDLILLCVRGEVSPGDFRRAASILTSRYGRHCFESMRRALAYSWRKTETRLTQLIARGPLDKPPEVEEFVLALLREMRPPA